MYLTFQGGLTPLFAAATNDCSECLLMLLQAGADLKTEDYVSANIFLFLTILNFVLQSCVYLPVSARSYGRPSCCWVGACTMP